MYEKVYYYYYCLFKSIKRNVDIDHGLASGFLSVIVSANVLTVLMISGAGKFVYNNVPVPLLVFAIFGGLYFFNNFYFITGKRYLVIKEQYAVEGYDKKKRYLIRAVIITVLTFVLFWLVGFLTDKYLYL